MHAFGLDWCDICAPVKVTFEGTSGRVAFDPFGQRRHYQLDVLEQRGDRETVKV